MRGSKEIPGVTLDSLGNIASYDIEKQCYAVFENVRLVLEDAGASWNNIVDVTGFLTNMKKDFPIYNKLYAEYFAGEGKPNPTRTTIQITALPTPIAIELKVIADTGIIPGSARALACYLRRPRRKIVEANTFVQRGAERCTRGACAPRELRVGCSASGVRLC